MLLHGGKDIDEERDKLQVAHGVLARGQKGRAGVGTQ